MNGFLKRRRKALAAGVGALAIAVSQGLIVGTAAKWVAVVSGVAAFYGVHRVVNEPGA